MILADIQIATNAFYRISFHRMLLGHFFSVLELR